MAGRLTGLLLLLAAMVSAEFPPVPPGLVPLGPSGPHVNPQYLLDPSWLDRFTITPIRIPGYPTGYPFPATFPFPVTYPLPFGFPYTPQVYENILPSLIAQYNAALTATANQVAAAAAAAAVAAPAISYRPPEQPVPATTSSASASSSTSSSGHSATV